MSRMIEDYRIDSDREATLVNMIHELEEELDASKKENEFYELNYILKEEHELAVALL